MAIECQSCTAPAELWICPQCITELRADLLSLAIGPEVAGKPTAGLLDALHDVVTKQTATGGSSGHRKRGDEMPDPFEPDTERGKPTRQGQASTLLQAARNTLTTIVRDLLGKREISPDRAFQIVSPKDFIGPLLPGWRRVPAGWQPTTAEVARWLATHVHALACDESAGVWKREIQALVKKITRAVDLPPAPIFCGQCDTTKVDRKLCGVNLYAHPSAIEITCPNCHSTHNVEKLRTRTINDSNDRAFTREELIGNQRTSDPTLYTTGIMGANDEFVHWQTFNRWVRERHLKPADYLRPGGRRHGNWRHSPEDIPRYRLGDVRRVRAKMEQQNPVKAKERV